MIIVTGAAGFIGSCFVKKLNDEGYKDLVLVDDFTREDKANNLAGKIYNQKVDRKDFTNWIEENNNQIEIIYHIGARTDTAEFSWEIMEELNLDYTKKVWNLCVKHGLPLVYASSAATYGLGEHGFDDKHELCEVLEPLNEYGRSKNEFDKWAVKQEKAPYFWVGLKFFNVYGPNEYHKKRMASVIYHAYNQIKATDKMKLFRSHNPNFKDGEQIRDFIYVKDLVNVLYFWLHHRKDSGIYNLGTGTARTFNDLTTATFKAMDKPVDISYIDTPEDIRDKYQYFTEANMQKLINAGYDIPFTSLEDGVTDYVKNYLIPGNYY